MLNGASFYSVGILTSSNVNIYRDKRLYFSKEGKMVTTVALKVAKNKPWISRINHDIGQLTASGILAKIGKTYNLPQTTGHSKTLESLEFDNFITAFCILGVGLILGTLMLGMERLQFRCIHQEHDQNVFAIK